MPTATEAQMEGTLQTKDEDTGTNDKATQEVQAVTSGTLDTDGQTDKVILVKGTKLHTNLEMKEMGGPTTDF